MKNLLTSDIATLQGKHAKIKLCKKADRVFKTYNESSYIDNEYFALRFLAENDIMNLNPKRESYFTISMDWINDAHSPSLKTDKEKIFLAKELALYLKKLHKTSYETFGLYITHEDIFSDNLLICENYGILYFIDWGLSKKRKSVYPDIASPALGIFNEHPEFYEILLREYFSDTEFIDYKRVKKHILDLYEECFNIRSDNNFETNSLNVRLKNALNIIDKLCYYASPNQSCALLGKI